MSTEIVTSAADALMKGMTLENIVFILVIILLAGIMAVFTSHFKKVGEQQAIHDDLKNIIIQVKAQTQATEAIRADFAQRLIESTESMKQQFIKKDAADLRIITAVADLAKLLGSGAHAISWATWFAAHAPHDLTEKRLSDYEAEIHTTLSQVVGARILLAALNADLHAKLAGLIECLYDLDVDFGKAKALLTADRQAGLAALASIHPQSKAYARRLVTDLSSWLQAEPIGKTISPASLTPTPKPS